MLFSSKYGLITSVASQRCWISSLNSERTTIANQQTKQVSFLDVTKAMAELKDRAAKAGRDMQTISVSVFGAPGDQKLVDTYRDIGARLNAP